jgi:hypothetical protein
MAACLTRWPYGHVGVELSLSALMIYHSPWIVVLSMGASVLKVAQRLE